jgi:hypothetical protein
MHPFCNRLIGLCFTLAVGAANAACPLPEPTLKKGDASIVWNVDGPPISVGRHFAMQVRVCPTDAKLIRVDATMPEHRHGMNYKASMKPLGDGVWRVQGMMFHMPGRWELRLDVQTATSTETLIEEINLP